MKKVELIDTNDYFVESQKAVNVALEKEESLYRDMPKVDKLRLIRERKKDTTSQEEYEAIVKLEKQLELEVRFNHTIPLVPDKYKETIQKNVVIEDAEVKQKISETKEELKKQLPYLRDTLLPLLTNLHTLNALGIVPINVKHILDSKYNDHRLFKVESLIKPVNLTYGKETITALKSIIEKIESIR